MSVTFVRLLVLVKVKLELLAAPALKPIREPLNNPFVRPVGKVPPD